MVLYISESIFKNYIENMCARYVCAQIPSRHGTHMHKYQQVIGLKCTKYLNPDGIRWTAWIRSNWEGVWLFEGTPTCGDISWEKNSINNQEM